MISRALKYEVYLDKFLICCKKFLSNAETNEVTGSNSGK